MYLGLFKNYHGFTWIQLEGGNLTRLSETQRHTRDRRELKITFAKRSRVNVMAKAMAAL